MSNFTVKIELDPVNPEHGGDVLLLYQLLSERTPEQSISHKSMPTFTEHCQFVRSMPYLHWYVIRVANAAVGAIYLSCQREIGIGILREHQRHEYGRAAVRMLMHYHPGKFLANVNPANEASIRFWEKLGFRHIQNTYVRD